MGDEQQRTMYVGNLHDDVTEAILYELFLQAGPLQRISRPKDRETGRLKNFAFVIFVHAVSVPYAVHMTNGVKLFGRSLKTQQRNNPVLPHYSTVGVHSIDCETTIEKCLNGTQEEEQEEQKYNNSQRNKRNSYGNNRNNHDSYGNKKFTPKPLDPNQTWKNNIDYHERQQQEHGSGPQLVSGVMMGMSGAADMSPQPGRHGRQSSSSYTSTPSSARSASHYHNLSNSILSRIGDGSGAAAAAVSGGGLGSDLRNRLGNQPAIGQANAYRSTRDQQYGSSYSYGAASNNYGGASNNYGGAMNNYGGGNNRYGGGSNNYGGYNNSYGSAYNDSYNSNSSYSSYGSGNNTRGHYSNSSYDRSYSSKDNSRDASRDRNGSYNQQRRY